MLEQEMEMSYIEGTTEDKRKGRRVNRRELLSVESCFVAFSFFIVLSQFLLYAVSDTISKPFRPLIVLILAIMVVRRGRLKLAVCTTSLAMSVYQCMVWFFYYPKGGALTEYLTIILYFMMLFSVSSFPWNRRELRLIVHSAFLATFVCAVVFFISNNMLDFSEHEYLFWGMHVNRNKNAYAFALGLVLGWHHLSFGKGNKKLLIVFMILLEGYCLIYSQSRGAFICVFLAFCVIVLNKLVGMYRNGNPFLPICFLIFLMSCILGYLLIKGSPVSRLVDGENLSGRDEGIKHAVELFIKAPVLGKIFGNGLLYEINNTVGVGVHLVYLTYILEGGIIATGMIIVLFLQSMRRMRGEIQWSLFMLAFFKTFVEGMDYYVFIPLILAICISNYENMFRRPGSELF